MNNILAYLFLILLVLGCFYSVIVFIGNFPTPKKIKQLRNQTNIFIPVSGVVAGLLYGLFLRWLAFNGNARQVFDVMSFTFIIITPVILGFFTVLVAEWKEKMSWKNKAILPWSTALLCLGATLILAWEGVICILMFLPIFFVLSSIGGLLAGAITYLRPAKSSKVLFGFTALLLPFLVSFVEQDYPTVNHYTTVNNQIVINASPESVWNEIKSVRTFQEEEHGFSMSHLIGFPRPVSAELEGTGVGAVRKAIFEGNLIFTETITEWNKDKLLAFSIKANSDEIPPTTLDEHVKIGGKYFDVLKGVYAIEKISDSQVILHLQSQFRTATHFEAYTGLWARFIMSDLQSYILQRIKDRAE